MREILDVCCDEQHRDIVINKPAQVGYTEVLHQIIGYGMAEDPSGIIVIRPSLDDAKSWMKERIDPMLAESPRLRGIVHSENGRRSSDDTLQRKVFPGGWLVAVGANSPSGLRSRPARRVIGDERSGWTLDAKQQGDPWDLAMERTTTFWNAKRVQGSTPGEDGICPTTLSLAESDWRERHVACPACGFREPFRWKSDDGTFRLVCDKDPADQLIPQTARYLCVACGTLIPEYEKGRMNAGGVWVPRFPGRAVVGFDIGPALCSPWLSWPEITEKWVKAKANHEKLKVFVTHVLAQVWKDLTERIDASALVSRAETAEELPAPIGGLFAAIDVQADRIESLLIGAGPDSEVWILDWAQHEGQPTTDVPWKEAWAHLTASRGVPLYGLAIDTGYLTDEVWKRVNLWNGAVRVIGVKGEDGRGRPWIARPTRVTSTRVRRPWIVGVDTAKDAIELRLKTPVPPGGPGAIHFAETLPSEFYNQLTAEEKKLDIVRGRPQKVWKLIPDRRNEGLDLTVYALAAMYAMGPAWLQGLSQLAEARTPREAPPVPEPEGVRTPAALIQQQRGGFVNAWRR
jgi:phage terminase large subunit GpA-like protein